MSSQESKPAHLRQTRLKGLGGEQKACKWLESKGFMILARNYFTQFGEIDIIALRGGLLHFIEVKTFRAGSLSPRYAITAKKLEKIYASIDVLLFTCRNLCLATESNLPKCERDAYNITQTLQALQIDIQSAQYCVDALLIWGDSIELMENISIESHSS